MKDRHSVRRKGRPLTKEFKSGFALLRTEEGIDLMPSNIELSGIEVRLVNEMSRERVLKSYVDTVRDKYDYILIDCMPSLGMMTFNALCSADSVIIPTTPEFLSAKGLEQLLGTINRVKRRINPDLKIDGILITIGLYFFGQIICVGIKPISK